MKILVVNWSWYPTGGDWTYIDNLNKLYKAKGYTVIPLSTVNAKNVDSEYTGNFIKASDFKETNKNKNIANTIWVVKNSIVNNNAVKKVNEILDANPDIAIAHLHNIHHYITPAILPELKRRNVKVVWSLHDYKILCPDSLFVSHGKICEKCKGGKFIECGLNKCKKKSTAASWLSSIEAYYYKYKKVYNLVDAYLCPSDFIKTKFIEFGYNEDRMHTTNLCYDIARLDKELERISTSNSENTKESQRYILYVGRIEKVKGIYTLINAVKGTDIKVKIAGTGSEFDEVKQYIGDNSLNNVELLGFQQKEMVYKLTVNAEFVVCPSEWYENFPFSIIESFLMRKAVIGSKIGGIPELVVNDKTGLLYEPGNEAELAAKIKALWLDKTKAVELGENARIHAEKLVNFDNHWEKLKSIFVNFN